MKPLICIMDYCLAPFSWTRLQAAAADGPVLGLQMSSRSGVHPWEKLEREDDFLRVTLFPEGDIREAATSEIVRRMRTVFQQHGPACVAVDGWSFTWSLTALWWCLENRVPAILLSDSTVISNPRTWWKERLKRRLVRLYSAGLVAGAPQRDYLLQLGMPPDRVFQGWDIVDNNYFATRSDEARRAAPALRARLALPEKYFLVVNRFVDVKNLPRLVEAYAAYRKAAGAQAWKLVLLGDGPLKPHLLELQTRLGLVDDLLLPGFKQYHELPDYYGLASALILASTSETWGLVVNEAMASGLPVLVSDRCGCARDLVRENFNGFSFDPLDVSRLAKLMLRLSSPGTDIAAMGKASRALISNWSPTTWAANLQLAIETTRGSKVPRLRTIDRLLLWLLIKR